MDEAPIEPTVPPVQEGVLARFVFAPALGAIWPRWLFLRALGAIFFSAFFALAFQIHGLIGPRGILPARELLADLATRFGFFGRLWSAPTVLWLGAGDGALTALVALGLASSLLLVLNVWPRATIALCAILFLSFVAAAQDFSMYQSDGMLMEAAFASFFLAPPGLRPKLANHAPPSRAALFLLRWEAFRIYFESGVVKVASHNPQWAHFTAMDHYYENGPLPTWLGWYAQQRLSHGFHAFSVGLTFFVELLVPWLFWFGRRARRVAFFIVTPFQIGIILTANYAFLNYLVLALGIALLDDDLLARVGLRVNEAKERLAIARWRMHVATAAIAWALYVDLLVFIGVPRDTLLAVPVNALETARVANAYGLFAVMTTARYELEFQATTDGTTWAAYPFRYKPQDPMKAPGIYAPYQPRFDWNLWFASLGSWRGNEWVLDVELRLMESEPSVLALFAGDPLHGQKPLRVRVVKWRYWFTTPEERRATGAWWNREELGLYAPVLERKPDGTVGVAGAR